MICKCCGKKLKYNIEQSKDYEKDIKYSVQITCGTYEIISYIDDIKKLFRVYKLMLKRWKKTLY